jgi:hypothetical protein
MWGTEMTYTCECAVQWLEEISREEEVAGSNSADRVATNFAQNFFTGGALPQLKEIFFRFFSFQPLPSVGTCPTKNTWQRQLCRRFFYQVGKAFAECIWGCGTWQSARIR